jgi:hypothetical protein
MDLPAAGARVVMDARARRHSLVRERPALQATAVHGLVQRLRGGRCGATAGRFGSGELIPESGQACDG